MAALSRRDTVTASKLNLQGALVGTPRGVGINDQEIAQVLTGGARVSKWVIRFGR
jgi:hypothetical protein